MKLSASKTQLVVIGTQQMLRHTPSVSICVGGSLIEESATVRNLGVTFDRSLTFSSHITNMKTRCNGLLVGLSHIRHSLPSELVDTVVESLVIPIVRYCITVYGSANQTNLKQVQSILNFCARVMTGRRKFDHISDVVNRNPVLNVKQLAFYHNVTALHKIITTGQPASLAQCLVQNIETPGRNTRHSDDIRLPSVRHNSGKGQFVYRAAAEYNRLPSHVKQWPSTVTANHVFPFGSACYIGMCRNVNTIQIQYNIAYFERYWGLKFWFKLALVTSFGMFIFFCTAHTFTADDFCLLLPWLLLVLVSSICDPQWEETSLEIRPSIRRLAFLFMQLSTLNSNIFLTRKLRVVWWYRDEFPGLIPNLATGLEKTRLKLKLCQPVAFY